MSVTLQISLTLSPGSGVQLESGFVAEYREALRRRPGFTHARLLRELDSDSEYQVELTFADEESRARWAASADHERVWPPLKQLANRSSPRRFHVCHEF